MLRILASAVVLVLLTGSVGATHQSEDVQLLLFVDAASRGDVAAMEELVAHGYNPRGKSDYDFRTAQHLAAAENRMESIVYLLEELRLNPNVVDRFRGTPIADAKRHKHPEMEVYLRSQGGGELCCP